MMRLFKPLSPTCGAWAATVALSFFVPMETAQSALTSVHTTLQAQLPTSRKEVTGHAPEPVNEITTSAASTKTTPGTSAAETPTETPPAAMPTSAKVEVPQSTDWDRTLEVAEPIITKPLIEACALLMLMLVLAVLVYRRNQRKDASTLALTQRLNEKAKVNSDTLLPTRGLQAEIMELDMELGPSIATTKESTHAFSLPMQSTPNMPVRTEMNLSKLQWAQQLLAAGEYELGRVLLTSVTETLHSQLQQRANSHLGTRQ